MQNFRNRFIAICMVLTMLLSFTGCTSETKSETVEQLSSGTQQEAQQTSATSDTKQEDKSGEEVPSQEETTTTYKDRVVIANSATLAKLDPQSNNTGVNGHIYEMTHNTLVSCDDVYFSSGGRGNLPQWRALYGKGCNLHVSEGS